MCRSSCAYGVMHTFVQPHSYGTRSTAGYLQRLQSSLCRSQPSTGSDACQRQHCCSARPNLVLHASPLTSPQPARHSARPVQTPTLARSLRRSQGHSARRPRAALRRAAQLPRRPRTAQPRAASLRDVPALHVLATLAGAPACRAARRRAARRRAALRSPAGRAARPGS